MSFLYTGLADPVLVDSLSRRLKKLRREKKELKRQWAEKTAEIRSVEQRQGVMFERESENGREWERAELVANGAPMLVPGDNGMLFDFQDQNPENFFDGGWEDLIGSCAGDSGETAKEPPSARSLGDIIGHVVGSSRGTDQGVPDTEKDV